MNKNALCALAPAILLALMLPACTGLTGGRGGGGGSGNIGVVNHVVIMLQENRSFDDYFGQMTAYRQRNNIPIVSSDGRINDLSTGNYSNNLFTPDGIPTTNIPSHHTGSVCTEDLTPDWAESHKMINISNPQLAGPSHAAMDGFAQTALDIGVLAQSLGVTLADQTGRRAMGHFDDSDLNYYYFMASNFAMSDALFSPVPTRTTVNRLYIHAATSQGHVHDPGALLTAKTIWQELDAAGISWKIYITDCPNPGFTYLSLFTYFNQPGVQAHIAPASQYFTDVQNGTLPAVSFIETGQFSGRDEHPSNFDPNNPTTVEDQVNVQIGANFASSVINAFMNSTAWKDGIFFWTTDEGGGAFDHVPPIAVRNPDGIQPRDLLPNDPKGDFTITGFRVPNMVISPFAKKNFVSHTPMDYTAILNFIETRFGLDSLTKRDASMPDMTEFFDFTGVPWATPPNPPAQRLDGVCDFTKQ